MGLNQRLQMPLLNRKRVHLSGRSTTHVAGTRCGVAGTPQGGRRAHHIAESRNARLRVDGLDDISCHFGAMVATSVAGKRVCGARLSGALATEAAMAK